ncbi:uncharacterized protein LOC124811392 [Hydra vulgaris]|uniref:uncharacterized protein LOC124811392 n=1 Tax=Hydra vulgaris TaxID=6087 RepID=UPI001F5F6EA5|nr:uncharacterized protein LOC124811392 [Hydra vulgaris]
MKDFMAFKSQSGEVYGNKLICEAVDITIDPLHWWSAFCKGQPLQNIAFKLLSLPASSAAVERSNKEYALQKTKKRNRLSDALCATVTKVAYNIKVQQSVKKKKKQAHTALQFSNGPIDMNFSSIISLKDSQPPHKIQRTDTVSLVSSWDSSDSEVTEGFEECNSNEEYNKQEEVDF